MRLSKRLTWIAFILPVVFGINYSCYWINQPSEEEAGSLSLSQDELSGAEYGYTLFLNDSLHPEKGYGFTLLLNKKELLRQSHEVNDEELILYKDKISAITAAELMIDKLKNASNQNSASPPTPTPTSSPLE